jgi:hypothetical protein
VNDWIRFGLEQDAAVATSMLLQGGNVDAYLESVNYTERLQAFKKAGGAL